MGFEFDGFRLDAAQRRLFAPDGTAVELPSRAFDVLLYMVERPGQLLDKAAILRAVWPQTVVEEGNLSQCIFALRRALGDTAGEHRFIATVPGRGYQFVAQVGTGAAAGTGAGAGAGEYPSPASGKGVPTDPATLPTGGSRKTRPLWVVSCIAALVLVGSFMWMFWPRADTSGAPTSAAAADTAPQTIAVLPFVDLSPAHDMDYFTDGIAEEMMNSLARVGSLRVIGRRSAFAFKGTNEDARSIGEKLKVDSILEGSVRKSGERIRIAARLVRTQDGVSLWSQNYDRKLDDVLDIQSAIAGEVAAALSPMLEPATGSHDLPTDGIQTKSPNAYNAYLRGIYQFQRDSASGFTRARDEFLHAVQLDPQFALANARLATTYMRLARSATGDFAENSLLAASSLARAIELDPRVPNLWWVRMWFGERQDRSLASTVNNLERALAASPDNSEVILLLANHYLWLGRRTEALQLYERARSADPLWNPAIYALAKANYLYKSDRQRSLALLDEMESLDSSDPQAADLRALMAFSEGRAHDWDHWKAKAIAAAPRDQPLHGYLSLDYGHLGMLDAALYHARLCRDLNPQSAASAYNIAHIDLFSGNVPAARSVVHRAIAERPADFLAQLAQAELQYFTGDCAGAIHSLELALPGYQWPAGSFSLMLNREEVVILVWCLRKQGDVARAQGFARAFALQMAPPITAGVMDGIQARMAAASSDRPALLQHLEALVETKSMAFAFARHEPMIQPYLDDPRVKTLLDTLDARRAEWRRIIPKSSMRVPIPAAPKAAGS